MEHCSSALDYLVACAKAIQYGRDLKLADSLLKRIWNLAADEPDQRKSKVVKYFAEALVRRAYGLYRPINAEINSQRRPYDFLYVVNDAIKTHALRITKRLHLIDFNVRHLGGEDYLFWILSDFYQHLPVRVSVISPAFLEKSVKQSFIKRVGSYEVELEDLKVVYANSLGEVDASMLDFRRTEDEAVVVFYSYKLHTLLAEAGAMEKELLKLRQINPEIVIIEEQEANHNDSSFIKRLEDSFQYYSHAFQYGIYDDDSMETIYRREIGNIVGCEGRDRVERHQTLAQWQSILLRAGFLPLRLRNPYRGTNILEEKGCLFYTEENRPMVSLSAWKLTDHFNPISFNTVQIQGFNPTPPSEDILQSLQVSLESFSLNRLAAFAEIYDMLEDLCSKYELPLALTYACGANVKRSPNKIMSDPNEKHTLSIETSSCYVTDLHSGVFIEDCVEHGEGQGITGKALQSDEPFLLVPGITLGYPFSTAGCPFSGHDSVAICLQNRYTIDDVYVLELFLPPKKKFWEQKFLAPRIFNDLQDMKKRFVKLRVHGTEVGFQKEAISNISQATRPMRSSAPASSPNDFLNSLNIAEPRDSFAVEMQVLNEQGGLIPNSHPPVPTRASSPAGTGPSHAPNTMSYDGLETQGTHEQGSGKQTFLQPIANNDNEVVKADANNLVISSAKRRKLTSNVWEEFIRTEDGKCAICSHCNRKFDGSSKKGTTHLRNHLERCKSRGTKVKDQPLIFPTRDSKNRSVGEGNSSFDQERSSMDVARMIIMLQCSLNMVENEYFSILLKNLQPMFKLQSQEALSMDILRVYREEKGRLIEYFDKLSCRFNLTISLWAHGLEKITYCVFTVQFVDDNWKLKKKILAFKTLGHKFDSRIFHEVLMDWKFDKKVCSVTIHNASSGLEIIEEIRKSWFCFEGSHPLSTFYISCDGCINDHLAKDKSGDKIDGAIKTSNACLLDIYNIYKKLSHREGRGYPLMNVKFDNNWKTCSLILAIATILDPQFKFAFVEFSYKKIYGYDAARIHLTMIRKSLTDIFNEYASNMYSRTSLCDDTNSLASLNDEEDTMETFDKWYKSKSDVNTEASWKSELDKYLQEPKLSYKEDDVLSWWCKHASSFPILGRMARDILATPMSSLISGSALNKKVMMDNPIFSGLDPQFIEAMICGRNWLESAKEIADDRADHAPLQKMAKRKREEKETHEEESCKNWNSEESIVGDKAQASCNMMRTLSLKNVGQEGRLLKSSEPNYRRDIRGLIEIPNDNPSSDKQSEFQCSSSDESDGEIIDREQAAWREEDVRAYLISPFTEKEKKRLNRWQSHEMSGKMVGHKEFSVIDYKLAPLLIFPHGVDEVEYYIDDSVVSTFFKLLKKRSDRFPKAYVNHYSFDSQIATYLIEGSRSDDEVLRWFKDDQKLIGVQKLFLPLCLSAHWVLFYVDTKEQKFLWLDSNIYSRTSNNVEKGSILRWFITSLLPAFGYNNANQWPFELRPNIPVQTNLIDCGLFVMKYADCLTHGDFFPFTQQDMPHFRHRTFLDLYRGRLHRQKP